MFGFWFISLLLVKSFVNITSATSYVSGPIQSVGLEEMACRTGQDDELR